MSVEEFDANKALDRKRHEEPSVMPAATAAAALALLGAANIIDNGLEDRQRNHDQSTQVESTIEAPTGAETPIPEFPDSELPHQSVEDLPPAVSSPTDIPPLPR